MADQGFQKRGSPFFQVLFNTRVRGGGGGGGLCGARISIINPVGGGERGGTPWPPPQKQEQDFWLFSGSYLQTYEYDYTCIVSHLHPMNNTLSNSQSDSLSEGPNSPNACQMSLLKREAGRENNLNSLN